MIFLLFSVSCSFFFPFTSSSILWSHFISSLLTSPTPCNVLSENLFDSDQNDEIQSNAAELLANVSRYDGEFTAKYFDIPVMDSLVFMCASKNNQVRRHVPLVLGMLLSRLDLFCPVLFCSILFCSVLFCSVLFCSVLFCSVLFCSVLFCPVLSCPVLFCPVLFCPVLSCNVIWCNVMWCDVMWCNVMWCVIRTNFTISSTPLFLSAPHQIAPHYSDL